MKNLYLVQVDVSACTGAEQAYLPYTAGVLAANAFLDETVKKNYCFKEFIFLREEVEKVIERMENPAVVGFSNYCWNTEFNKLLAGRIKEKWADCIIVFDMRYAKIVISVIFKFLQIKILRRIIFLEYFDFISTATCTITNHYHPDMDKRCESMAVALFYCVKKHIKINRFEKYLFVYN